MSRVISEALKCLHCVFPNKRLIESTEVVWDVKHCLNTLLIYSLVCLYSLVINFLTFLLKVVSGTLNSYD